MDNTIKEYLAGISHGKLRQLLSYALSAKSFYWNTGSCLVSGDGKGNIRINRDRHNPDEYPMVYLTTLTVLAETIRGMLEDK
jgi:hypothetical protein